MLHYDSTNPLGSVMHPDTGTRIRIRIRIRIQSINAGGFMQIEVKSVK